MNFQAQFLIIVFLRKLLYLETTIAEPSTGIRMASKEIATGTPAEIAILQIGTNNENKANSDTDSLHGDPNAEPLGRKSNNDKENKSPTQSSL
jgi:hypothetical protein